VLHRDLDKLEDIVWVKRPARLPVVLTREEVEALLARIEGTYWLMASLLYGSGLRLLECLRLRVKDLDFEYRQVIVRDGKGRKDRIVPLPQCTLQILREHYKTHRNEKFIFPAPGRAGIYEAKSNIPLPGSSIQTVLKKALRQNRYDRHPAYLDANNGLSSPCALSDSGWRNRK